MSAAHRLNPDDAKKFRPKLKLYQGSSLKFCEKVLGIETLEEYQKKVLQAVDENDRVAIAACHDVGKSYLMARIALGFCAKYKNAKVITTAPTFNQVERIIWAELRSAHAASKVPLGGVLNNTSWNVDPLNHPNWYALGFTSRNSAGKIMDAETTQSAFQGFHAPHVLIIFDEATGIPPNIWVMAEGMMTSAHVKLVAIGNPTSMACEFYRCFKKRDWKKVYLSCFDSPNLTINNIKNLADLEREVNHYKDLKDEEAMQYLNNYKVVRGYLLTAKWVVSKAAEWGLDHPLTLSKILGQFPKTGVNTLVSLGDVEQAQLRVHTPTISDRKVIGVDVARFGTDRTILTGLHGLQQVKWQPFSKLDEVLVTGEVIAMARAMGGVDVIVVDETGLGGAVVTLLKYAVKNGDLPSNTEIRGVQFGEKKSMTDDEQKKFRNQKARMFDYLGVDIKKPKGLCLLNENVYLEELPTIKYGFDEKGVKFILSKDEYKKSTGRNSPDSSDSLALANLGRYDEISLVGSMTSDLVDDTPGTLAGSIHSDESEY